MWFRVFVVSLILSFHTVVHAQESIDELAPRASAVFLCEVLQLEEYDGRPGDGNWAVVVKLKPIRGSGPKPTTIYVVKEWGGNRGNNPPPPLPKILKHDSLKKGMQCWFIFASQQDFNAESHRVLHWWPAGSEGKYKRMIESAIANDHFRWSPTYHSLFDLTIEHNRHDDHWDVRVRRGSKTLWQSKQREKMHEDVMNLSVLDGGGARFDALVGMKSQPLLLCSSVIELGETNEFGVPAGKCIEELHYSARDGNLVHRTIRENVTHLVKLVEFDYDYATGNKVAERRFGWVPTGGLALGAAKEQWFRKIEERYDATTGRLLSKKWMRRRGAIWVEVEVK